MSTGDLERLKALPEPRETAEERCRRGLEEAGIEITYPTGERTPRKRRRVKVEGTPLSERVIRDRR
ncbi:MAG: hypothetical protein WA990_01965 [Rubrobacteraceae bacterium]